MRTRERMREGERERERERKVTVTLSCDGRYTIKLPGSRFDGMMPGSVVAVAINNVILRRKKKRAMKVVCA